ncbi:jacalin-related lectin 3 isoform X1 [Amborella trichopoda]|uniref:Jacalin-type lectin domain-containing protein n=1 Tax=Amborella trichopoda TaxID=13333 RepID=W1P0W1_AMBTC|nr:jacalin-related lectin 3 isoform X1 [Amborella trichopoda]ERN01274.1 hypothetical protein AMTR_s00002p00249920 [Amborella trichopoda]|eukprot:XP_006838705.1 jacalin-related lectin 3 isoform X1 [Amborella trichopoda]
MQNLEVGSKKAVSVGPWGGQGGSPWDDGVHTGVKQIVIVHGGAIDSLRFEYDKKGQSVWSEKHGGNGGCKTDKVKLEYPEEVLTWLSGHYGPMSSGCPTIIRSLTFQTNLKKYGPFGVQQGTHFSFTMSGGKVVGFHGRSGWHLDSIGLHLKPLSDPEPESELPNYYSQVLVPAQSTTKNGYDIVHGTDAKGHYDFVLKVRDKKDAFNRSSQVSQTPSMAREESKNKLQLANFSSDSSKGEKGTSNGGGNVTHGPWGGNGGSIFDDGVYTGIRQINLSRNVGIMSIKVLYDRNGQAVWGNRHGGAAGSFKSDKVVFDYPFEILTYITGNYGAAFLMGPMVIKSLTFHTTKGQYGPYGDQQGMSFSSQSVAGRIVGFHGRSGWYLDAIGVHVFPTQAISKPQFPPSHSFKPEDAQIAEVNNPYWSTKSVPSSGGHGEEVVMGTVKEAVPFGPGPWGGDGGRPWDDGVYSGIKQIVLIRGEAVCSIQIEYDRNGQSVWSARHGGRGGETTHRIKFEYPNEVLTCITGYYGAVARDDRLEVIKSLTFCTSRGKYGPYGEELGTYFTSNRTEGKVVGFHGRSGSYLYAIGVHMQHWLGERTVPKSSSLLSKYFS